MPESFKCKFNFYNKHFFTCIRNYANYISKYYSCILALILLHYLNVNNVTFCINIVAFFLVFSVQPMASSTAYEEMRQFWDKNRQLNRPLSPHLSIYK